ncbi:glycosyltransferase family 9 protein [Chitinophaga flava]|uniref:ADP-heptose--LPS heptosyltransferase n=1 Tax=Chitinophaga flava TaxID=2259036 RepID=A0A365XWY2_9BACT|nr:hypothetical protein [Chitinophaga flava]RBL90511.1 hypothetical protein DF182_29075 [Chitinophaga flava]
MEKSKAILNKLSEQAVSFRTESISQVLILFEDRVNYLGDCCLFVDKLPYLRTFFNKANLTAVSFNLKNVRFFKAFLANNPHLDEISSANWLELDYSRFDVVVVATYREEAVLAMFQRRYEEQILSGRFNLVVLSLSELLLPPGPKARFIFPVLQSLEMYLKVHRSGQLYISDAERKWADAWLEARGMKENDSLFIMLDSTSNREKLIRIDVYFDVLASLLNNSDAKVLVFDERSIGKEEFYREWLGAENMNRIIFSKSMGLREDLCLIGSGYTRLVFGPCTGLMHCASSIYNNYVNNGLPLEDVPLMVTYTGQYGDPRETAAKWWGGSPLVNCLLLKKKGDRKEIVQLKNLSEEEKELNDQLPCIEYTADVLADFLNQRITETGLIRS